MLSFTELIALDTDLRETLTLTLYLDGRSENPAWRTAWRRALKHEESRLRQDLDNASHEEREAFARNVEALEAHLAQRRGALDAPGWLGVAAHGRVVLDAPLRSPSPTMGHWGFGVPLAPFLCAPDALGGAWVVIVDSRAARIFHCDDDGVQRIDTVRASHHVEAAESMGGRTGKFHTGTRGGVGRDAADRERLESRARMLRALAERVKELSPMVPIFVGGTPQLVDQALKVMQGAGLASLIETPALGARARVCEITRAVRDGLVILRQESESALVDELLRRVAGDDLAAAGAAATGRALDELSVRTLLLSESLVTTQPEVAEVFVRSALGQDADVKVVTGHAARVLEESGGAGVLLRFSPFHAVPTRDAELAAV